MNVDAIPAELRALPQWVCWRYKLRDGKKTKEPCQVNGKHASSTNRDTWTDFDTAYRAASIFDGIGFVFTPDDPYTGVDLDSCVKDGVISPEAQARINGLDSYSEFSVRGEGVHILVRAEQRHSSKRKSKVEAYNRGRFFAMTGNHIPGTPETIECRQVELDALLLEVFGPNGAEEKAPSLPARPVDLSDADLIDRAMRVKKTGAEFTTMWNGQIPAGKSHSEADYALCRHLAYWTAKDPQRIDRLFRQSRLMRAKWGRGDYRDRTIRRAIAACKDVYTPREPEPLPEPPPETFGAEAADGPLPEAEPEAEPSRRLLTLADILSGDCPEVKWLVERKIPEQSICMVAGDSGVGKSWIITHIGLCVAAELPVFGRFPTRRANVLICDSEQGENLVRRRIRRLFTGLALHHSIPSDLPFIVHFGAFKLDKPEHVQTTADWLRRREIGLLLADPLIDCYPPNTDENSSTSIAIYFERVRQVVAQTGCSIVFCHHARKLSAVGGNTAGERLRGSTAIKAVLDSFFFVRKLKGGVLLVEHDKCRVAEALPSFLLEITDPDESSTVLRYAGAAEESTDQTAIAAAFVTRTLSDAGGSLLRKELLSMAEGEGLKARTVDRALKEAVDGGGLAKAQDGTAVRYTLSVEVGEDDE